MDPENERHFNLNDMQKAIKRNELKTIALVKRVDTLQRSSEENNRALTTSINTLNTVLKELKSTMQEQVAFKIKQETINSFTREKNGNSRTLVYFIVSQAIVLAIAATSSIISLMSN